MITHTITCDKCGATTNHPIDWVTVRIRHAVMFPGAKNSSIDLCPNCREMLGPLVELDKS